MKIRNAVALSLVTFGLLLPTHAALAAPSKSLAKLQLPHVTVTLANIVDAGTFVQFPAGRGRGGGAAPAAAQGRGGPGGRGASASPFADLSAFCRVMATLTPSVDSEIKMEVW